MNLLLIGCAAFLLLLSELSQATETSASVLSIPEPDTVNADNVERQRTLSGSALSFNWIGKDPAPILRFYDHYWLQRGWNDPFTAFATKPEAWDSFQSAAENPDSLTTIYRKAWEDKDRQFKADLIVTVFTAIGDEVPNSATLTVRRMETGEPDKNVWSGTVELGLDQARGNTDNNSYKAGIALLGKPGIWEHANDIKLLKRSSENVDYIESSKARLTSRRPFSERSYFFTGLGYLDDGFDGFTEQYSVSLGYGLKLLDNAKTQWDTSLGIGYRTTSELKSFADGEEVKGKNLNGAVMVFVSGFEYRLTDNTALVDDLRLESGDDNTYLENEAALLVSMNAKLALKAGVLVKHNTSPGPDATRTDTITSLSLVYNLHSHLTGG